MIPKINFIWSFIYQSDVHSVFIKTEEYDYDLYEKYVSDFINKLKKEWGKYGKEILQFMEKISGLKWKKPEIDCYVIKISAFYSISYPLTLPIQLEAGENVYTLSLERYIDMLVHELIHVLFVQNEKNTDKYFDHLLNNKYKNENFNVAIHVPVHAIHRKIFLKFFGGDRLKEEIKMSGYYPDYKRSWEIVNSEGEEKILKEMKDLFSLPKSKSV